MRILCDTSVIIASFLPNHSHHNISLRYMKKIVGKELTAFLSLHSLAETYSVITRIPIELRPSPQEALSLIEGTLMIHFQMIELTLLDYKKALHFIANKSYAGGIIFDALICEAARKAQATHLVTWNVKDFQRLSDGITITTPEELI